ncbi:MAG: DegT/DnrJ/EryC1/StrS family aminotransferase [Deltaproteobacteria bacterium]|nr:MAG: DegT/DnrJ/EryC1/StrS family aminotransferase [Deltaproteobacteria bacterium]
MKIPWYKPKFWGKEREYLLDAFDSTWISHGDYVDRLELNFSRALQSPFGVSTSNGTTALQLALLALEIGPGDEVIVPGFSFAGPVNMILAVGAKPVFCDVEKDTFLIDLQKITELLTPKTKCIMVVHTYGNVCEMDAINKLAKDHNLFVIEDAAEAIFSKYKGEYAGTLSDIGSFSFQATKTITTGEGGMVLTKDEGLKEKMKLIANHGMGETKYWHVGQAFNFRLTNLQAALGVAQLEHQEKNISLRKELYSTYLKKLAGSSLQVFKPSVEPALWAMAINLDKDVNRDLVMRNLMAKGIETRPGFSSFFQMKRYNCPLLPVAEKLTRSIILLPFFLDLKEEEITFICKELVSNNL